MKNIVQKQFLVSWNSVHNDGMEVRQKVAIEMADQSDTFFIALSYMH